jgi:acyl-CoA oxidase
MILPPVYADNNRQQLILEALKVGEITFKDGLDHKSDVFRYTAYPGPLGNANPFGIMPLLFTPFVKLQATYEQIREWIPKAESGEIIGCYTQTE